MSLGKPTTAAQDLLWWLQPSNERHKKTILYVEMNPVRGRLSATAWEWPWSSARAHTVESVMDAVLDCRWADHFESWDYVAWKEILGAGMMNGEEGRHPARDADRRTAGLAQIPGRVGEARGQAAQSPGTW